MEVEVLVKQRFVVTHVRIEIPVDEGDEDIPVDFPLREGDYWKATINVDTGQIEKWPKGRTGDMHVKVRDGGSYFLEDNDGNVVASIRENYVPNELIPGDYSDYVILQINEDGIITNWPDNPSAQEFFDN